MPQPALAADWEPNDDQTAFRFHLDPEATFASGRPITPEDVIASLERVIAAGDTSLAALSLEAVTGFRAFVEGEADHVSGLTAPDARTVRVGLETPLSVLPEVLSSPLLSVVDPETIDATTSATSTSAGPGRWPPTDDDGLRRRAPRGRPREPRRPWSCTPYEDDEAAYDAVRRR